MTVLTSLLVVAALLATLWYASRQRSARSGVPAAPLTADEQARAGRLRGHVTTLAETIGERNLWHPAQLEAAADYIEGQLQGYGLRVERQVYSIEDQPVRNLAVEIPGSARPDQILLVGAHYDSVAGSPGANDNASGVAALLELARQLADSRPGRTLRLVAFVNEEPPFFKSPQMGSLVYARAAEKRGEKIVAMLCLETIGYFSPSRNSQRFPSPLLRFFYPTTGNFLAFVTDLSSRQLLRQSLQDFRRRSDFPAEGLVAPGWLPGIDWSDHWSFWQIGVPAVMLTDTAPYRYPHYHGSGDRADRLIYPEFTRAVAGMIGMVEELVSYPSPLKDQQ